MSADRRRQIKLLYNQAMELNEMDVQAFLSVRCRDDQQLLLEVQALLAADETVRVYKLEPDNLVGMKTVGPASGPLSVGTILADRYRIQQELARGGMSVVFLAEDLQLLSRRVVVKVLLEETSQDPWIRQKFLQEMEALSRIDHPCVVGVHDNGLTPQGNQFLVMQFIEGTTLRKMIQPGGLEKQRAAKIIRQIGQALTAAHEKGVWHRDLKPENVMLQILGGEDHVTLIDFGIAGIQNSQFTGEETKVAGSLSYMAPEQYAGQACAASDTYSLAVLACELLTGAAPGTQREWKIPDSAKAQIEKSMSYDPAFRHVTPREFGEELFRALVFAPRKIPPAGGVEMGNLLFTDLVGYSLLPANKQKDHLAQLHEIVRSSAQYRMAETSGNIINLPTGDGIALVFFGDPTAPAQCAIEVSDMLKSKPDLKLRMGIHSGPVYRIADTNANTNVAGSGINIAQQVMDYGDTGHILVSGAMNDVLGQLSNWQPYLKHLGTCSLNGGEKIQVYNLTTDMAGNADIPEKVTAQQTGRSRWPPIALSRSAVYLGILAIVLVVLPLANLWPSRINWSSMTEEQRRVLRYHMNVQKYRDGKPYDAPFRMGGERVFEAEYRVQLSISAPAGGYLYVLNEGASSASEKPILNILDWAALEPDEHLQVPRDGYFLFDHERGVEKLWIVWSNEIVPALQSLQKWANPRDLGAVNESGQARAILALLKKFANTKVDVRNDKAKLETELSGYGKVLAHMIPMDHE